MRALRIVAVSLLLLVSAVAVAPPASAVPTNGHIFTIDRPIPMWAAGYSVNNQTHLCPTYIGGCGPHHMVNPNPDWSRNYWYDADYFWTGPGMCTWVWTPDVHDVALGDWLWTGEVARGGTGGLWWPVNYPWERLTPDPC